MKKKKSSSRFLFHSLTGENNTYRQDTTYVDDSYHNEAFGTNSLVCGVLAPGQLLPYQKEAVADQLPKYLL